jgi:hypothetical protein
MNVSLYSSFSILQFKISTSGEGKRKDEGEREDHCESEGEGRTKTRPYTKTSRRTKAREKARSKWRKSNGAETKVGESGWASEISFPQY